MSASAAVRVPAETDSRVSVDANIAHRLRQNAQRTPDKKALVFPIGRGAGAETTFDAWSYQRLDRTSDAYARGLLKAGIRRGTKTIVMLKPSPDLYAVIFALFKVGSIPVIVDPGMGPKRMLHCYETAKAEAFIGIPLAHVVRLARPKSFASARILITVGRPRLGGGHSLSDLAEHATEPFPLQAVSPDDTVVINFTTGSTGPARGVEYTNGGVAAMCAALPPLYGDTTDAVTFVTLPLLALFDSLLGLTAVLAPMDPTRPATVDSARLSAAILQFGCTHMFASPALLNRLGTDNRRAGRRLPSLRAVISGGAPIMPRIVAQIREVLGPDARVYATYGATEALPMASVESREILGELRERTAGGHGTCAGYPMPGLQVRIVPIDDAPVATATPEWALPVGEVGEIAVRGAIVSPRYHQDPTNDALAKTGDTGGTWHRTGDLGSLDEAGRIWFAGRKSHRVQTPSALRFTVQCEGLFNSHPDVYRTALVGLGARGQQRPVLCVELAAAASSDRLEAIAGELRARAKANPLTRDIDEILFHPGFPVDIRHNAKIEREELALWAAKRVPHDASDGAASPDARRWTRLVPISGWLFLLYGVVFPFMHPVLRGLWIIDLILSVGVHALQLFAAVPAGKRAGYPLPAIVLNTMIFGATWWKLVEPRELRGRPLLSSSGGGT